MCFEGSRLQVPDVPELESLFVDLDSDAFPIIQQSTSQSESCGACRLECQPEVLQTSKGSKHGSITKQPMTSVPNGCCKAEPVVDDSKPKRALK